MLLHSQRDGQEEEIPLHPPPNIHSPLSFFFCTQALLCLLCPGFLSFALIEVSLRFLVSATSDGCITAEPSGFFLTCRTDTRSTYVLFHTPSSYLPCQRNRGKMCSSDACGAASHTWLQFSSLKSMTGLDMNYILVI